MLVKGGRKIHVQPAAGLYLSNKKCYSQTFDQFVNRSYM